MLHSQNIICISSIDWDFIWQGHQEIMSTLAKNGNKVLFIENTGVRAPRIRDIPRIKNRIKNWLRGVKGIRKEMDNLYVFSPLVLPFPYSRIARRINRFLLLPILQKWIKIMDFADSIIWTFLPTSLTIDIIDNIYKKLAIYYCIDNFAASTTLARKIKSSEKRLLKKADLVFVTAKALYDYCSQFNDKVHLFPFAVNLSEFEKLRINNYELPEDLRNKKGPIIGYVGGVHRWIDQELIKSLANIYTNWAFVFVGPIQTDISFLQKSENIYFLGHKEHKELPRYIKAFDVCVIPYLVTDYTKNVYPTKLNEYLAMGKPVVSSSLPEINSFNEKYDNIVYVGKNVEEFGKRIKLAIKEDTQVQRKRRIEVARENSWENRIEQMSSLIKTEVERKKIDKEARWKENLLNFYRAAQRRLVRAGVICFLTYFVFFRTPFVWFLASPLKISQAPAKADVIVAFGGGVGEGGSPGKSTIERARYAAELYNTGYANGVIFSSGYVYKYNDAENMKLLALSAGVPEKDIILEQKANSTYENAKFTKEILDDYNWSSILLVSSPYNMRRASLAFKKLDKNLKIFYTPVVNPQFYCREKVVKWEQIRAIAHEYLGIIYYWWKRWI